MGALEVAVNRGGPLQLCQAMWAPLYEAVLDILGDTGVILPLGDHYHGQPNAITFTTRRRHANGVEAIFTWSETPYTFDTKLDLTDPATFQGIVPVIAFNGIDEKVDTPDAAYWSFGATGASPDPDFSIGLWMLIDTSQTAQAFLISKAKSNAPTSREWQFYHTGTPQITFEAWDESASAVIGRYRAAGITKGVWAFVVVTKGTGTTSASIKIYLNGAQVDDSDSNAGTYTAIEDGTAVVTLGYRVAASNDNFFKGKMAGGPIGPFTTSAELTVEQIKRLYEIGRRALAL